MTIFSWQKPQSSRRYRQLLAPFDSTIQKTPFSLHSRMWYLPKIRHLVNLQGATYICTKMTKFSLELVLLTVYFNTQCFQYPSNVFCPPALISILNWLGKSDKRILKKLSKKKCHPLFQFLPRINPASLKLRQVKPLFPTCNTERFESSFISLRLSFNYNLAVTNLM